MYSTVCVQKLYNYSFLSDWSTQRLNCTQGNRHSVMKMNTLLTLGSCVLLTRDRLGKKLFIVCMSHKKKTLIINNVKLDYICSDAFYNTWGFTFHKLGLYTLPFIRLNANSTVILHTFHCEWKQFTYYCGLVIMNRKIEVANITVAR